MNNAKSERLQRLKSHVTFVPEEPGTIALLLLLFAFLALTPKAGCSMAQAATPPAASSIPSTG